MVGLRVPSILLYSAVLGTVPGISVWVVGFVFDINPALGHFPAGLCRGVDVFICALERKCNVTRRK